MFDAFQKFTKGLVVILCFVLAVVLTSLAFPNFDRVHWYKQIVFTVLSPPQKAATSISDFFGDIWHHYFAISDAAKENDLLKERLAAANQTILSLEDIRKENINLHEMLSIADSIKRDGIGAKVIACDVFAEFKTVTIDKGSADGIVKNQAVLGPGGLVGRIGQVARSESQVFLISDPNSYVDVYVQRTGSRALLVGTSRSATLRPFYSLSRLEYLKRVSDVNDGDVVVTSGLDKLFPAGIPVGTLTEVENTTSGIFRDAKVVPFVDLSSARNVLVLK